MDEVEDGATWVVLNPSRISRPLYASVGCRADDDLLRIDL